MKNQISLNVRYLLWRKGVPREQWSVWLARHTSLGEEFPRALTWGKVSDPEVSTDQLRELARAFELEEESLRFADLPREGVVVLKENLKYLLGIAGRGGKKSLATDLAIDPTTVSRWLHGSCKPQARSLRRIAEHFGLPSGTNLHDEPVFLSPEPMALTEQRRWLRDSIDALPDAEMRELYPALRRLLREP